MDEQETLEAVFSLVGLSVFICLATIGTMVASVDADSFLHIEFNPEEDFIILISLIVINIIFLFYFLSQSSKFRKSKNLNYRTGEILYISDKIRLYSVIYSPVPIVFIYYFTKYNQTSITFYLFVIIISGITLILISFYNSYRIKREIREETAEK